MDTDKSRWGRRQWLFAFPEDQSRWRIIPGEAKLIDGCYHKMEFPGFETRSGESFGVSATFYVLESIHSDEAGFYGPIQKIVIQNGELVSCETVGPKERVFVVQTSQPK